MFQHQGAIFREVIENKVERMFQILITFKNRRGFSAKDCGICLSFIKRVIKYKQYTVNHNSVILLR